MASNSIGSLFIDIEARTARLEADLGKANRLLRQVANETASISKVMNSAFNTARTAVAGFVFYLATMGLSAVKNMVTAQYDHARALAKTSQETGVAVSDLQAYTKAAEVMGVANVNLGKIFRELNKAQADVQRGVRGSMREFNLLGISEEFVANSIPKELFEKVIEQMTRMGSVTNKTRIASDLFGKEASELMPLLSGSANAIAKAREELEATGEAFSRLDIARVRVAAEAMGDLGDAWEGFKKKMAVALAPLMYDLANAARKAIDAIDIDALAVKVTNAVSTIYAFFATIPERFSYAIASIKLKLIELRNFAAGTPLGNLMGMDEAAEDTAAITAEIEELRESIKKTGISIETDFHDKVDAVLRNLRVGVSTSQRAVSESTRIMVDTFTSSFSQVSDTIADFIMGAEINLKDLTKLIVREVISMAVKLAIINPILNSVFDFAGTKLPTMYGNGVGVTGELPGKAIGGPVMAGDIAMVGEEGPEIVQFTRSGYVNNTGKTASMLAGAGGGGGGIIINMVQHFNDGVSKQELTAAVPHIIRSATNAVMDAVQRGGSYRARMQGA